MIAAACLLGGCVSAGGSVTQRTKTISMNPTASLGQASSLSAEPTEYGFKEAGLARSAKTLLFAYKVKTEGAGLIFPDTVSEIVWYGLIDVQKYYYQVIKPTYYIQWFKPDGTLVRDKTLRPFTPSCPTDGFYVDELSFKKISSDERVGRWRVRVFRKDRLVDDRYFKIIKAS